MLTHFHPKFSIITVTYNAAAVIEDTLQSVITQTYKNIEYIIIDGASTDRTMEIIGRYRKHIHTVVSEPDRGLYDAMNKGIRLATGDYVCFLNAGDELHEDDTLQLIVHSLTGLAGLPDVIYGRTAIVDEEGIFCECAASNRLRTLHGTVSAKGCSSATRLSSPAATMPCPMTSATASPLTSTGVSA